MYEGNHHFSSHDLWSTCRFLAFILLSCFCSIGCFTSGFFPIKSFFCISGAIWWVSAFCDWLWAQLGFSFSPWRKSGSKNSMAHPTCLKRQEKQKWLRKGLLSHFLLLEKRSICCKQLVLLTDVSIFPPTSKRTKKLEVLPRHTYNGAEKGKLLPFSHPLPPSD